MPAKRPSPRPDSSPPSTPRPRPDRTTERRPRLPAPEAYKKGSQLAAKSKWDEAVEMFLDAVRQDPGNLLYRRTLRATECRKHRNNKVGAAITRGARLRTLERVRTARQAGDWKKVDFHAELGLLVNPWDPVLQIELGRSLMERGYRDVAAFAFRCAEEVGSDDADLADWIRQAEAPAETPPSE